MHSTSCIGVVVVEIGQSWRDGDGDVGNWDFDKLGEFSQYFGLGRELGRGGDVSERAAIVTWKAFEMSLLYDLLGCTTGTCAVVSSMLRAHPQRCT